MSVRSWCLQNKINEKQFYYWQCKLREVASESLPTVAQSSKFVELPVSTVPSTQSTVQEFVPAIIVRIGHASIELAQDVQPDLLASVLKVLSNVQ